MTDSPLHRLGLRFKSISPRLRLFVGIVAVVVVADQLTKWWAVATLTRAFDTPAGQSQPLGLGEKVQAFMWQRHPSRYREGVIIQVSVIDSFWHFRYAENPGSAFSFLSGQPSWFRTPFFLVVSLAAMIFIVFYYRRTTPEQKWLRTALALVFGGAIGNFLDRMHLGYVIDFIDWHWFDKATWPTFNIADSAITVGIAVMLIEMWFQKNNGPDGASSRKKSDKA